MLPVPFWDETRNRGANQHGVMEYCVISKKQFCQLVARESINNTSPKYRENWNREPLRRENISHKLVYHHAGPYREMEEFNFTFLSLIIDTSLSCDNISNNDLFTFVSLSFEIRKTSCNRS